jgi:hypothetical protein|tara:strand:+ start:41 stop:658 length:618 start_codon:yes stop_codon:yes gene_type:complete
MGRLLIDTIPFTLTKRQINESLEDNNGRLIVNGVLQRAEAENQNGRVYPRSILEREVEKYKGREIKENRAFGELDHPESSVVELKNTSHIIRDVYWKGDDVMGKVEVLKTPAGNILKELLEAGCTVGISSRGMGSVKEASNGKSVTVEDDFDLICWDFVSNPSTHGAFMRPVNESVVSKGKTPSYKKINTLVRDIICEIDGVCSI